MDFFLIIRYNYCGDRVKLFIYYSLSGNGDYVAKCYNDIGADIRKVETVKKMPKSFIFQILTGGFLAGIGNRAKLVNFDNSVDKYEEIIIGSPIWNGRLTPAINTVLDEINLFNKKVSFVLYSGSGSAPKAIKRIKEKYSGANILIMKEPLKNKDLVKKLIKGDYK